MLFFKKFIQFTFIMIFVFVFKTSDSQSVYAVQPSNRVMVEYSVLLMKRTTAFIVQPDYCGTKGEGNPIFGFSIRIAKGQIGLTYMAHVANMGDSGWVFTDAVVGNNHGSIEGFAIKVLPAFSNKYDVYYMAHVQGTGDTPWYRNGQYCGTRGQKRHVEGIAIYIAEKGRDNQNAGDARKEVAPTLDTRKSTGNEGTSGAVDAPTLDTQKSRDKSGEASMRKASDAQKDRANREKARKEAIEKREKAQDLQKDRANREKARKLQKDRENREKARREARELDAQ